MAHKTTDILPDEGFAVEGFIFGRGVVAKRERGNSGSVEALATAMEEEGIGATSETLCLVFVDGSADLDDGVGGQM